MGKIIYEVVMLAVQLVTAGSLVYIAMFLHAFQKGWLV